MYKYSMYRTVVDVVAPSVVRRWRAEHGRGRDQAHVRHREHVRVAVGQPGEPQ